MLVCQCPLSYSEHIVSLPSSNFPTCKIQLNIITYKLIYLGILNFTLMTEGKKPPQLLKNKKTSDCLQCCIISVPAL